MIQFVEIILKISTIWYKKETNRKKCGYFFFLFLLLLTVLRFFTPPLDVWKQMIKKSNLEVFLYYFNITGVHKKDICFYLSSGWFFFSRFFSCFSWSSWHVKISFYNCHLKVFRARRIVHCIKKAIFYKKKNFAGNLTVTVIQYNYKLYKKKKKKVS